MMLKYFSSIRLRTVFCRVIFVKKKFVLIHSQNRESGSTAFKINFPESSNSRKINSHIFLKHSKFEPVGSEFFLM